jgi:hypothetical protein
LKLQENFQRVMWYIKFFGNRSIIKTPRKSLYKYH